MVSFAFGNIMGYISAYFWGENWRMLFWSGVIFPALWGILLAFLPESPRYYVLKGKIHEARNVLIKLRNASSRKYSDLSDCDIQAHNSCQVEDEL